MTMIQFEQDRQTLANTFTLLGPLFLRGIQPEDLAFLYAVPEFAAFLPNLNGMNSMKYQDEWAAEHYRVFGMNVYPFGSAFLDSSRMLGGVSTDEVLSFYSNGGFSPSNQSEAPDHIGHELMFVGHLLREQNDQLLNDFLRNHLLTWLLPLSLAVGRQGNGFFNALSDTVISLVETCLESIEGGNGSEIFSLPPGNEDFLENPQTRLKDIAEYFLTPVYSGIYLSRENIAALGRETKVPRGFGDRVQLLSNLFHSGVDYDQIGNVFILLRDVIDEWIADYGKWEQHPPFVSYASLWKSRAIGARQVITKILREVK